MNSLFKKIGLAITFSPTGKALLAESARLQKLFNCELVLIHIGPKEQKAEKALNKLITECSLDREKLRIIWSAGEPAKTILKESKKADIDLLVCGALEKENIIKKYLGSVARKLMRNEFISTLILYSPSEQPQGFKSFCVSTDFSAVSERGIRIAYGFARLENAEKFIIIKDCYVPGLTSTVLSTGNSEQIERAKNNVLNDEIQKLNIFVREMNLKGLEVTTHCVYGKEGWEAGNFARESKADLFVITTPPKKYGFIDILFPHEDEYLYEDLPTNLLILR
ncbi:MAG: hypothetical protein Kow0098_00200 [Ignavibacteriaceae bacterium]